MIVSDVWGRRLRLAVQAAAVCSWGVLAILSLVPGPERPHTGAPGNFEHWMAYFMSAFVTRLGFERPASAGQGLAFSVAAGLFELAQLFIPGRGASVPNWANSGLGALMGTVLALAVLGLVRLGTPAAGQAR